MRVKDDVQRLIALPSEGYSRPPFVRSQLNIKTRESKENRGSHEPALAKPIELRFILREALMKRAAIVGGGIGGLATAIALRKIGFEAHIYERSPELKEAGSGMSLWPNAVRSLEQIDSGVLNKLRTNGRSLRRLLIKEASGSLVKALRLPFTDLSGIAVHRAELQSSLAEALPASSIHLSHTFLRLENRAASVVLHFDNGTSTEVDLVVGCDGIHSSVRKSLDLECKLTNRGYCVWRGMVRTNPKKDVGDSGLDRDGDFSESYGRGQRFGIMRLGPGRIHWYAVANNSLRPAALSESAALLQLFSAWHDPIPELIKSAESIIRTRVQDRLSFLPWTKGRIAILGDAAHPISPNFGQGACLAIEDAVVLAASLRSTPEISNALRQYEKSRRRRCLEVLITSREVGRFAQIQNRTFVHLRNQVLRLAPSAFTTYWFRRSCEFHPPLLPTCLESGEPHAADVHSPARESGFPVGSTAACDSDVGASTGWSQAVCSCASHSGSLDGRRPRTIEHHSRELHACSSGLTASSSREVGRTHLDHEVRPKCAQVTRTVESQ